MLTFLTAYFWFSLVLSTVLWAYALFSQPTVSKRVADDQVVHGCATIAIAPIISLLVIPTTYLQAVGLDSLGLPGWLAWAGLGASMAGAVIAGFAKRGTASGAASALPVLPYLIAWVGLQALMAR